MKLSLMLEKHNEAGTRGLAASLGDSFLLQNNRIYRNVRQKALSFGFSFSDRPNPDYLALPLGQLENVLSTKVIPYTDNVTALKQLSSKSNAIVWDHISDNLKPNHVFHESCHAIARQAGAKIPKKDMQLQILTLLVEESFANTCEFFSIADATDQLSRNFLEVNSFCKAFEDRTNLKKAIEKNGAVEVFKVLLLGYIHSNFLNEKISDADFKKILEISGIKTVEAGTLKSLVKNCFSLNPRFRYYTTEMYLRLNGITTPIEQVLDFDHFSFIKNNSALVEMINSLSQIAGEENER